MGSRSDDARVCTCLTYLTDRPPLAIFLFFKMPGIDGVKFRKPVVPGDTLVMEVRKEAREGRE